MMVPLQAPGGTVLVVFAAVFLVSVVLFGVVVYFVSRVAHSSTTDSSPETTVVPNNATQTDGGRPEDDPDSEDRTYADRAREESVDTERTDDEPITADRSDAGWTATTLDDKKETRALSRSTRRLIDWFVVLALVLVGFWAVVAGIAISSLADRDLITELVEDDVIQSDILSDAVLVEFAHTAATWSSFGVIVTGVVMLLGGVIFGWYRVRFSRRLDEAPGAVPAMASNALLGAFITAVASFIPFSAILGGIVAGYLQQGDSWTGLRAGVLAGLFVAVPVFIVLGFLTFGLFASGLAFLGLIVVTGLLFAILFSVAMSAIGGYAGGYLVTRKTTQQTDD